MRQKQDKNTVVSDKFIEPCPSGVAVGDLPVPRALAGFPPGVEYVPRVPVLDFTSELRREARELLARCDGRRGPHARARVASQRA